MTKVNYLDKAALNTRIDLLVVTIKDLKTEVHALAVSALFHANEHGDLTFLTRIHGAIGTIARQKALAAWAGEFAPVKFNEKSKGFKLDKKARADGKVFDLAGANLAPYYDFIPETVPTPMTLERFKKLITNLGKKLDDAENISMTDAEFALACKMAEDVAEIAERELDAEVKDAA